MNIKSLNEIRKLLSMHYNTLHSADYLDGRKLLVRKVSDGYTKPVYFSTLQVDTVEIEGLPILKRSWRK